MNKQNILARILRRNQTTQEYKVWQLLRNSQFRNLKFRRQYPIGDYIVDFICKEKKLIIEIDGGQHNKTEIIVIDEERTRYLESKGYKILRFWNNDIDNNLKGVYEELLKYLS